MENTTDVLEFTSVGDVFPTVEFPLMDTETNTITWTENNSHNNETAINDSTANITIYPMIKQPLHMIAIYSTAYAIVFILALIGNTLVVSLVYNNKRMHNVTNYFIVNLAMADILVSLVNLPITLLSNIFTDLELLCVKQRPIAVDRYLAICFTMEYTITRRKARLMILCIWTWAVCIMAPWAVFYEQEIYRTPKQSIPICYQKWPTFPPNLEGAYFVGAIFVTCYSIPLILITVCYSMIGFRVWTRKAPGVSNTSGVIYKSKIKVVKMLMVVVVVFTFSWLPLYTITVSKYYGKKNTKEIQKIVNTIIYPIVQWLGSSNSCVNPLIYCLFSKRYRRGFKVLLLKCFKSDTANLNYSSTNRELDQCTQNGYCNINRNTTSTTTKTSSIKSKISVKFNTYENVNARRCPTNFV
ncbi:unnamed protein product [Owenia fusiformis]|uniref:G-protein coupled receptors family 1 profile domain-containing protein n=1 Tax=Owenia fusiformis TaxID=6347 RepID=A0A8S4PHJ7_OWEFU|nr:unnamed protein product [Owenia fusiformis]